MFKRLSVSLRRLVLVLAALSPVVLVNPVYAAPSSCAGISIVCFYEHINYGGNGYITVPTVGVCNNLPVSWDNVVSSFWNTTPHTLTFYEFSGCTGASINWPMGNGYADLTKALIPRQGNWNDKLTSYRLN